MAHTTAPSQEGHDMRDIRRQAVLAVVAAIAGVALVIAVDRLTYRPPAAAVSTPDAPPPPGWTEVCDSAAIGFVCRTYPPGDDSWQPKAPVPPQPPLPTPRPGGEDVR